MTTSFVIEVSVILTLDDPELADPPPLWDWQAIEELTPGYTIVDAGFRRLNPDQNEIN